MPSYPAAERLDLVEEVQGHAVADPWRWLEDAGDPRTGAWSAAQDELCRRTLDVLPGRAALAARLDGLLRAGAVGVPVWRGGRRFAVRREPDQDHGVLSVLEPDGTERVLLDPNALDPAGTTTLDAWSPSTGGERLAYQLSTGGDEESRLHVLDVTTGERLDGPVERCRYSPVAWLPGAEELFYVRRLPPAAVPAGEEAFHRRVWRHRVGADPDTDLEVHGAGLDPTNYYGVGVSEDGRWLVVSASAGTAPRDDVWIADLGTGASGPHVPGSDARGSEPVLEPVQSGVDARLSAWVARDGLLYLWTDRDAPRGRLCVTDPTRPGYDGWRELVAEDPDGVLTDVELVDGPGVGRPLLAVGRSRHAIAEVALHDLRTGEPVAEVALPGLGSSAGLSADPDGGGTLWVGYTDHVTPPGVWTADTASADADGDPVRLVLELAAPGRVDVPAVRARQVTYASADGTPVRMVVLAPAGSEPDRPRPTVLYGYGGFGISLTPAYSAPILAWVEAGGVHAVANLRGGGEEGEQWHRAGMREHKQNVFDDLHAAAGHLLEAGWTTPGQLGIMGGSNGGLLVGAALTQRPELYRAVVCSAPLLDMVRYERFGLGRTWNDEYGTAADPVELGWLLSYSPYHHVAAGTRYPAVLFTVFDADTRVDPLHARKLCAALQEATAATPVEAPVLLRAERDVGHGARSVSRSVALGTDTLAFLADRLGLRIGAPADAVRPAAVTDHR